MKVALMTRGDLEGIGGELSFTEAKSGFVFLSFASRFCTSATDKKIRLFTSDLQDKNEYKVCLTSIIYSLF